MITFTGDAKDFICMFEGAALVEVKQAKKSDLDQRAQFFVTVHSMALSELNLQNAASSVVRRLEITRVGRSLESASASVTSPRSSSNEASTL